MASKRYARGRSPHPGIVLVKPSPPRLAWRMKFTDPDSGTVMWAPLDPHYFRTEKARRDAAISKSKDIARRKAELEAGAVRMKNVPIEEGIERFFEDNPQLAATTAELYRSAAAKFLTWCEARRLDTLDELTRGALMAFRGELLRQPAQESVSGKGRGGREEGSRARSEHTVNWELRSVARILNYLRSAQLVARLSGEDIGEGLATLRAASHTIDFFRTAEITSLLEAALEHDLQTFQATRAEHAGFAEKGQTRRYKPIAPAVFAAIATGMRLGELARLTWEDVDLSALGEDGSEVGEIHIRASQSKTKRGRTIDLGVSPALRRVLIAMREVSGCVPSDAVFGITYDEAESAGKRLSSRFGAPPGSPWQKCRRTCGTYLTNAPGIFGAASAYRSARQLGHSVVVAERNYVGVVRGIPRDARTIEAAMGVEDLAAAIEADQRSRK